MKKLFISLVVAGCFLAACNTKKDGGDQSVILAKNKKTALNFVNAIVKKEIDSAYLNCAPGFIDYGSGENEPVTKLDSIKNAMKFLLKAFPDMKISDVKTVAEGDTVIVLGNWSGTLNGELGTVKYPNKKFNFADIDLFVFNKEGKIVSHKSLQSEIVMMHQMGMPLPPTK